MLRIVPLLSERDAAQHLVVTQVEIDAQPKILHVFSPIGLMIKARIDNTSAADDSGNFYVEFYASAKDEKHESAGKVICGSRVLVANLPPRSTAVVEMHASARLPQGVAMGEGRVWAGVRAFPSKIASQQLWVEDLMGVQRIARSAATGGRAAMMHLADMHWHGQWRAAMMHLADMHWHGQGGAKQDMREAMRWYSLCGPSTYAQSDLLNPAYAEAHLMHCGPLPADLSPLATERGYSRAWLAYALRLDALGEENLGDMQNLTKWEKDFLGGGDYSPYESAPWAQLNLGVWYTLGRNVPKSLPQAWYWFKRAAEHGLRDAEYNLGLFYQDGSAVEQDSRMAASLFQQAADQGHVKAHLSLGACYMEGVGVNKDAHLSLGACYMEGVGVNKDVQRALQLFTVPAQKGVANAQYNLANVNLRIVVQRALKLFTVPAQKGVAKAQYKVVVMYSRGTDTKRDTVLYSRGTGTKRDAVQAAAWYLKAADQGHRAWYLKAADQGHREAQVCYAGLYKGDGVCYATCLYKGDGVPQDLPAAASLFQESGARGHSQAQFNSGVMFQRGEGVPRDREKAAAWWKQGADQAVMFQRGEGVPLDREKAAAWWKQGADQGHSQAQLELGRFHEELAEEALAAPAAVREEMALRTLLSREVFEKYILIAEEDAGLGSRKAPTEMDVKLFLKIVTSFLWIVPALGCVERVKMRHQWTGSGPMRFEQFQRYLEEVMRKALIPVPDDIDDVLAKNSSPKNKGAPRALLSPKGKALLMRRMTSVEVAGRTIQVSEGADPWQALKQKAAHRLQRTVKVEVETTQHILAAYRGDSPKKSLTLARAQVVSRSMGLEIAQLEAEIERIQAAMNFQEWRINQSETDYSALKREADVLASKGRREEAQEKNATADRVQNVREKAVKALETQTEQRALVREKAVKALETQTEQRALVKAKLARKQRKLAGVAAEAAAATPDTDAEQYAREMRLIREQHATYTDAEQYAREMRLIREQVRVEEERMEDSEDNGRSKYQ
ncbi:hypothetical protein T484DRAFT_1761947, partial [Baffinella frigidus]